MNLNNVGMKLKRSFIKLQEQSVSTSIYSYQELDDMIALKYQKIHPKISESSSETFQPPETTELGKVNRILTRLKNQQQLNQLLSILEFTQFSAVKSKLNDFFLRLFLHPSERDSISIPFETILLDFHRFFPYFEEEDQVELLDALSTMLLQVSPSEGQDESSLPLYQLTIHVCTLILKKCIKINFATNLTITYVNSILQDSIKIASAVSQTKKKLIKKAVYVGEFLTFASEIEPLMSANDANMNRLIQQFFITCILFTLDDLDYLKKWNSSLDRIARFFPPLIQRKPKIDFSSTKVRIQELLTLYSIEKHYKTEDVISIFSKLLPGLPTKYLQQMDQSDVIYALSIYLLEKVRAERGIFGQILEYIEVKYIPHFSGILKSMIDPLLNIFYKYLANLTDTERRDMCASFTMCELIQQFASRNERVQTRVDPILKDFANNYPIQICNTEVLKSVATTYNELSKNEDQQRIQIFSEIIDKMFNEAFSSVPNSFNAAIFHSQVGDNLFDQNCSSLFPILQKLSPDLNEKIMKQVMMRSLVSGQAKFANEELIRMVQNDTERYILSASYLVMNPDSDIVMDMMKQSDSQTLLLAWTHVAMESVKMSKLIIPLLIQTFIDLSKNNVGIFGLKKVEKVKTETDKSETKTQKVKKTKNSESESESDDDDESEKSESNENENDEVLVLNDELFVVDEEMIQFQTTLLQFFIENITLSRHYADYASVLMCAAEKTFVQHASIVPAVISYAYLGCLVMKSPTKVTTRYFNNLQQIILKLSLLAYSFTYDDYVLKYITQRELFMLQQLIDYLPKVLKKCKKADKAKTDQKEPSNAEEPQEQEKAAEKTSSNKSADKTSSNKSVEKTSSRKSSDKLVDNNKISEVSKICLHNVEMNYLQEDQKYSQLNKLSEVVSFLLCDEVQIFNAFLNQTHTPPSLSKVLLQYQNKSSDATDAKRIKEIWEIAPEALYPFCRMQHVGGTVLTQINDMIEKDNYIGPSVPMLAPIYALSTKPNLKYLDIWKTIPGSKALSLLTPKMMKNTISAKYVARCFQRFTRRESLLFLPQLVQSLRFDKSEVLREFLIGYCKQSEVFCHYLLWNILAEKNNPIGNNDKLPSILKDLEKTIIDNMNEKEKKNYENEFGLIDKLDEVSQKLLPMEIDQRPPAFIDMLNELELPEGLYIPSNPNYKIISIDSEHSVPLKSHARVPILVHFQVYDENDEEKKPIPFSCIFKIHDDVRQDAMMIQFIDMIKQILNDAGIDHYLFPYRVFATGENRGVIECIHNAKSRHDLGVATNEFLLTYFINKYGQVGTPGFQRAQDNFIKSVAPYSLICYLFQVKDRHNANIMIDEDGHMLHIDFGFIFEISPGGNMKFEKAPFKLTREMIDVLGGSKDALAFQKFVKLLTKCFFAVRARHEELEAITSLMMNAGFPCFLPDSIKKLQARMFINKSAKETCNEIIKLVDSSYESSFTTMYDGFQKKSNDIWF